MSQVKDLADQVIVAVKGYTSKALADLASRVEQFEAKLAAIPAPLKGDKGDAGDNADPALVEALVQQHVAKAVEAIPPPVHGKDADPEQIAIAVTKAVEALPKPQNGKDVTEEQLTAAVSKHLAEHPIPIPKDGTSVTADDVLPQLRVELAKAVESIPKPEKGKDGLNAFEVAVSLGFEGDVYAWQETLRGAPGKKGDDGKSVTAEEVLPDLKAEVQKAIAALPIPKDGNDSTVTAEDFRVLFEAEQAKALLDFERRLEDRFQKSIDRIEPPKDGADGFGFDDMEVLFDGERTFTLKFVREDRVKEFPFKLPVPIDRGVWKSGSYERGDSVTFGGSIWIAQRDTQSRPETDDSWRLSVKRGRDGKDSTQPKVIEPLRPVRIGNPPAERG
jgi:hypothetical protein